MSTEKDVFVHIIGHLLKQPSLSRRQQIFISLWAANGRIDSLFHVDGRYAPHNVDDETQIEQTTEVINCDDGDNVFASELTDIGSSLCLLTIKVITSLVDLLDKMNIRHKATSASGAAGTELPASIAFLDYFFALAAHLLRATVAVSKSFFVGKSSSKKTSGALASQGSQAVSTICSILWQSHTNEMQKAKSYFQSEFINLIDVANGSNSPDNFVAPNQSSSPASPDNSKAYSLVIEQCGVVRGRAALVFVSSILAVMTQQLPQSVSLQTGKSSAGKTTKGGTSSGGASFFGPKTLTKTIELLTLFLAQNEPNASQCFGVLKSETLHPYEVLLKRVEISEHFAAASLAAVKGLKDLYNLPSADQVARGSLFPCIDTSDWTQGASDEIDMTQVSASQQQPNSYFDTNLSSSTAAFASELTPQPETSHIPNGNQQTSQINNLFSNIVVKQKLFVWLLPEITSTIHARLQAESLGTLSQQHSGRNSATDGPQPLDMTLTNTDFEDQCHSAIRVNTLMWVLEMCSWVVEDGINQANNSSSSPSGTFPNAMAEIIVKRVVPALSLIYDVVRAYSIHATNVDGVSVGSITNVLPYAAKIFERLATSIQKSMTGNHAIPLLLREIRVVFQRADETENLAVSLPSSLTSGSALDSDSAPNQMLLAADPFADHDRPDAARFLAKSKRFWLTSLWANMALEGDRTNDLNQRNFLIGSFWSDHFARILQRGDAQTSTSDFSLVNIPVALKQMALFTRLFATEVNMSWRKNEVAEMPKTTAATSVRENTHSELFTSADPNMSALTYSFLTCFLLKTPIVSAPAGVSTSASTRPCSDFLAQFICHPSSSARLVLPKRALETVSEWRTKGHQPLDDRRTLAEQYNRNSFELPPPSRRLSLNNTFNSPSSLASNSAIGSGRPSERFAIDGIGVSNMSTTTNSTRVTEKAMATRNTTASTIGNTNQYQMQYELTPTTRYVVEPSQNVNNANEFEDDNARDNGAASPLVKQKVVDTAAYGSIHVNANNRSTGLAQNTSTNLFGNQSNIQIASFTNGPTTTTAAPTISNHSLAASLSAVEALMGSLRGHNTEYISLQEQLHDAQQLSKRLSEENTQLRKNYQREVSNIRQDNKMLKEQLEVSKQEALEESSRHASEMMNTVRKLEDRNKKVAELEAQNQALNQRVRRQETKAQQMMALMASE